MFTPGSLISARGREWVVQPQSSAEALHLRPFGGSDDDVISLVPDLELTPVSSAEFAWPDPSRPGNRDAARLLHDAMRLKLRAGAGPFRSFGNIAVEPRAYQLVPLLMALRQEIVRLLIADDVGIGKTIEAGLIVRELLDRGEIARCAVLCPPHLVEQWISELRERFHIEAVALTGSSARRLENDLPSGFKLFDQHPFVVVSLDYIKSERHRDHFLSIAPECIVVDEAHTCTHKGLGKQLRFELLRLLADDPLRHMLLLTATPHSGDDAAFYNLLGLIQPAFAGLLDATDAQRGVLREQLAAHFVQRRRKDIDEWQDSHTSLFPKRFIKEVTYSLDGKWGRFFDNVQDYCLNLAERTERESNQAARMVWYATLALLRCVSSSPAAAEKALTTRLQGFQESDPEILSHDDRLIDGTSDDLDISDLEPAGAIEETTLLEDLITEARSLAGTKGDPKLAALVTHLRGLVGEGFRPVVFCRYIATARYVATQLTKEFPQLTIEAITGEYTPDERELRVQGLGEAEHPLLVATDCLSEGINLQMHFNAVVHYDLAWNPTRHEQREGRVDRFGQRAPEVRCTMLYGQDNPIDGFILNVILKKAEAIRLELGVLVPMPEDEQRINQALIKASLMKRRQANDKQMLLSLEEELAPVEAAWQDAMERAKANRTKFVQRRIKPEEVLPEWRKQLDILGGEEDVTRFVTSALSRLNSPLSAPGKKGRHFDPRHLPTILRERLSEAGIEKPLQIDFHYPPAPEARFIQRSHPIVALLADTLLEEALAPTLNRVPLAARCAVTVTKAVTSVTTIFLLRLRHQLIATRQGRTSHLMAEETALLAVRGRANPEWLPEDAVPELLSAEPTGNLDPSAATTEITKSLDFLRQHADRLEALAKSRADSLLADHRRVRNAADDKGSYSVKPCLPVDLIGISVLLPDLL